jgi:glycosyltransferase involved in cell wall biosynthesis
MSDTSVPAAPAVLIPAYKPTDALVRLVDRLSAMPFRAVVVVDDGSGPAFEARFAAVAGMPRVSVLRHAVNRGKGAALKTGFNHVLCAWPDASGVVTADADGQHHPDDIRRVADALAAHGGDVILGARDVGAGAPLRSRFGNGITRLLFGLLAGRRLSDTQTGLRGIPMGVVPPLLRLGSSGYEFELEMLLLCKHLDVRIREVGIRTIYVDGNASSHFDPLFDSMRIYFVLLRFGALSLMTALIDNAIFFVAFQAQASVVLAQVLARSGALVFNYAGARSVVFLSGESHRRIFPKYMLLVLVSGVVSYGLIQLLRESLGLGVISAKLVAETTLFIANFTIQRDLIFGQLTQRLMLFRKVEAR